MRKIKEILLIHCRNIIRSLAWITLIEPVTNLIRRVYVITMYNSSCTLKMFTRRKWDLLLLGWFDFLPLSISCVQCSVLSWLMMLTTIDMVWRCGCCDTWHQVLLTSDRLGTKHLVRANIISSSFTSSGETPLTAAKPINTSASKPQVTNIWEIFVRQGEENSEL